MNNSLYIEMDTFLQGDDIIHFQAGRLDEQKSMEEARQILELTGNTKKLLRTLDIPCGFGRHCQPFSALGHQVTGVDISASFIQYAQTQSDAKQLPVQYLQSDMIAFAAPSPFDLITNLFNSFGYYDDAGNQDLLHSFFQLLRPGGTVLIDTINAKSLGDSGFLHEVLITNEEDTLRITKKYGAKPGLIHYRMDIVRDGQVRHTTYSIQHYTASEITAMLQRAGLEQVTFFSDLSGQAFEDSSKRMIVRARKPL